MQETINIARKMAIEVFSQEILRVHMLKTREPIQTPPESRQSGQPFRSDRLEALTAFALHDVFLDAKCHVWVDPIARTATVEAV